MDITPGFDHHEKILDELTTNCGALYCHVRTGKRYRLLDTCKIKQPDGAWIDGAAYSPDATLDVMYVRPIADFYEAFELAGYAVEGDHLEDV